MNLRADGRTGRGAVVVLALSACITVAPASAHAQMVNVTSGDSSRRPFSALFGGAAEQVPRGPQSLVLDAAVFGGYDDDIFARGQNPNVGQRVSGQFLGSQAALTYSRRFVTSTLSAAAAGAFRYLTDEDDLVPTYASGYVGYDTALGRRTNLNLRQSFVYRPYYTPVVFPPSSPLGPSLGTPVEGSGLPDPGVGPPDDFTLASDQDGVRYSTNAQLSRQLSPRSQIQFRGMYGRADFSSSELDGIDNTRWFAGATYNYDISRDLAARLGYLYRLYNTQTGGTQIAHDLNIGVVFNKPFVLSRGKTMLSVIPGTTMLVRERISETGDGDRVQLRLIGTATVTHTFTADWQASADYVHFVGFMDGFAEPIEGDRIGATIGGLLTRALDVSVSAGYLSGAIGMQVRNFDTALGSARLRLALHPRAALFAQYFYYHYSYKDGVADQLLAAPEMDRHGFRAGLNVWLPMIR